MEMRQQGSETDKEGDKARQRGRCTDADDYYREALEVEQSQQLTNYIKSRQDSVWHCFGNARVWMGMTLEFSDAIIRTPKGKILKSQKHYNTIKDCPNCG